MAKGRYSVTYERDQDDPGIWVAEVNELPGCHTWGRGIEQTRRRVRQALALWLDDEEAADEAEFREVFPLTARALSDLEFLRELAAAKQELEARRQELQERLHQGRVRFVRKMIRGKRPWSRRDLAKLLDLSHQRIDQLVDK